MPLADVTSLLTDTAPIDRAAAPDARAPFDEIPARMACYLLEGDAGEPVFLATVGDLRAALRRRLADTAPDTRSKRVEYARIAARVRYKIVHSPLAANWTYLRAARLLFPAEYRRMISWRPTHFLCINPQSPYPRFERSETLDDAALYFGPIAERRATDKLIETLQDLFDLCRYHHILVQAPHGKACAYKEMGKCPAPCDGTIDMPRYREQLRAAIDFVSAPPDATHPRVGYTRWRTAQETAMKAAAAALEFERAGKLKQALARAAIIETEPFSRMDAVARFAYLALQPGQGKPFLEPFLIHGGTITPLEQIRKKDLPSACQLLHARTRELAAIPVRTPLLPEQTEAVSLIAHHLLRGADDAGVFLPLHYIAEPAAIERAATELFERKNPPRAMAEQSSVREDDPAPPLPAESAPPAAPPSLTDQRT